MKESFSRSELLLGEGAVAHLSRCRVAVFGIGGVGGYAVEALARTGIGAFDLVDSDVISPSNINRQILATHATVGQRKVDAARDRIAAINPDAAVTVHDCFFLPDTADAFDFSQYDYVVDAIDTVTAKLELIARAKASGTPIISACGAGNKLDPTAFRVADIARTQMCPLARVLRTELRRRGINHLKVVYSEEPPVGSVQTDPAHPGRNLPGSVAFVPSVMGLIIAGEVIKDLLAAKGDAVCPVL